MENELECVVGERTPLRGKRDKRGREEAGDGTTSRSVKTTPRPSVRDAVKGKPFGGSIDVNGPKKSFV